MTSLHAYPSTIFLHTSNSCSYGCHCAGDTVTNLMFNVNLGVVPPVSDDSTRVHLKDGPDYINANFVDVSLLAVKHKFMLTLLRYDSMS